MEGENPVNSFGVVVIESSKVNECEFSTMMLI